MLTLATSNAAKYEPFAAELDRLQIVLENPSRPLPEIQSLSFFQTLEIKARAAAELFRRPVLVDDAGLVLEEYQPFPGPLTSTVIPSIGPAGLRRLLEGVSDRARMECHLGCWVQGALRHWWAWVGGRVDVSRSPRDGRMILSDLFVPDEPHQDDRLVHRARALAALEAGIFELHLDLAPSPPPYESTCGSRSDYQCPFCAEIDGDSTSIFAQMAGERLASRVVYQDENFLVMPPIGQFAEGGLLLMPREHIISFAHLQPKLYPVLERLLAAITGAVAERWGVPPLVFEHGPAPERGKGVCCVDHAHFNIFPVRASVRPQLAQRMSMRIGSLNDLRRLQAAEFGYLFVQENGGTRWAYDGRSAPTQLVRRIITSQIGVPDRWHWRDYPGYDELVATYHALKGRIRP